MSKKEKKYIYIVTTMRDLETGNNPHSRCWFSKLKDAKLTIEINDLDLHECYYDYAVIEKVREYTLALVDKEWWYKWNNRKKKYMPIDKPKKLKYVCNFGIG